MAELEGHTASGQTDKAEGQVTRAVFLPFSRWRQQVALPCLRGSYWAQLQQQKRWS